MSEFPFSKFKSTLFDYKKYWNDRYINQGTSGDGSYGVLALFKAKIINEFICENNINSVIEFGCGDGNNLGLYKINQYLGFDVSIKSILLNIDKNKDDSSKSFMIYDPQYFKNNGYLKADLVMCLDVLYHITNDADYFKTLSDIFTMSNKYVLLYTPLDAYKTCPYSGGHIKHRDTLNDLKKYSNFKVANIIQNEYPEKSSAAFILLQKS